MMMRLLLLWALVTTAVASHDDAKVLFPLEPLLQRNSAQQVDQIGQFAHQQSDVALRLTARLQENILLSPDDVCAQYNEQLAGRMTCECVRKGATGVRIDCADVAETCTGGEAFCFMGSFWLILNEQLQSEVAVSCTNATQTPEPLNTCVQIFPSSPNNYTVVDECIATLNSKVCNYCYQCPTEQGSNATAITFDCCNVVTDAIATCSAIAANGAMYVLYDRINAEDIGKCDGVREPSSASTLGRWMASLLALAVGSL